MDTGIRRYGWGWSSMSCDNVAILHYGYRHTPVWLGLVVNEL